MIMSPFTPIFFPSAKADGTESRYVQTFSTDDTILVEILGMPSETLDFTLYSEPAHAKVTLSAPEAHTLNASLKLYVYKLKLAEGCYSVTFEGRKSAVFAVSADESLSDSTVLLQYSPADNRTRADVVAMVNNTRLFFSFRIPGGFKDGGWSFSVDNEQFVCQDSDIVELYGRESTQKTLTIGGSEGVPVWFGQMVNRILTCRYVYIDGWRYARSQSSVPEKDQVAEGVNSFVLSQKVQQVNYLDPKIEDVL